MKRILLALIVLMGFSTLSTAQQTFGPMDYRILGQSNGVAALDSKGLLIPTQLPIGNSIMSSGALCDGSTDDTTVINTYLATFTSTGGLIYIPSGKQCYIGSGNLIVPANVILTGASSATASVNIGNSAILLNPLYTIMLRSGAQLVNLSILRYGLTVSPTTAQEIAAVLQWGTENSRGVTLAGGGVRILHDYIAGFNTAIYGSTWGDFIIEDVLGDDYNGVFISGAGDNSLIQDVRFEPYTCIASGSTCHSSEFPLTSVAQGSPGTTLQFAAASIPSVQVGDYANILTNVGTSVGPIPLGTTVATVSNTTGVVTLSQATTSAVALGSTVTFGGGWARPGVSFYLQGNSGNNTGWYCTRCFSFMYRIGFILDGVGVGQMDQGGFEWQNSVDPATNGFGTVGVRMVGNSGGILIQSSYAGGHSIEFSVEQQRGSVQLNTLNIGLPDLGTAGVSGLAGVAGLYLNGASGTQTVETLSGSAIAGDTATIVINGTTIAYTVGTGESRNDVMVNLTREINSNLTLTTAHIAAAWSGLTINLYAPPATTLTVSTSVSGAGTMSFASSTLAPTLGAWGTLTGYISSAQAPVPSILVAPNDNLPFVINNPPISNTGGYNGIFSIDPTSTLVQIKGLPVALATTPSGCGGSPSIATGSTDAHGTITEGTTATGCVLTFRTAWPMTPVCTISSPTGSTLTSYAVTTTTLILVNASASNNKYSYICTE